jgi:hypothetical protein
MVFYLMEKHGESSVPPAIKDNKDVIQQEVAVNFTTVVILTQPPLDMFETT